MLQTRQNLSGKFTNYQIFKKLLCPWNKFCIHPHLGYYDFSEKLLSAYTAWRPGRWTQMIDYDFMRWPSSTVIRKHQPFDKTFSRLMDNRYYYWSLVKGRVDNSLKVSNQLVVTFLLYLARRIIRWYTNDKNAEAIVNAMEKMLYIFKIIIP